MAGDFNVFTAQYLDADKERGIDNIYKDLKTANENLKKIEDSINVLSKAIISIENRLSAGGL